MESGIPPKPILPMGIKFILRREAAQDLAANRQMLRLRAA